VVVSEEVASGPSSQRGWLGPCALVELIICGGDGVWRRILRGAHDHTFEHIGFEHAAWDPLSSPQRGFVDIQSAQIFNGSALAASTLQLTAARNSECDRRDVFHATVSRSTLTTKPCGPCVCSAAAQSPFGAAISATSPASTPSLRREARSTSPSSTAASKMSVEGASSLGASPTAPPAAPTAHPPPTTTHRAAPATSGGRAQTRPSRSRTEGCWSPTRASRGRRSFTVPTRSSWGTTSVTQLSGPELWID
jgi:hypothetical protein